MNKIEKCLVVKSISGEYTVFKDNIKYICKPRGVFRHDDKCVKVGDYVDIDSENQIITKIYNRKNDLNRPVIANVDKVFLLTSIKEPSLNLNLLDKMISILEYNDIETILVFTKEDLLTETEKNNFDIIKNYYENIGYKVYVSSIDGVSDNIVCEISGFVCVLMGQSGVGKSTLLNNIDKELNLETNEISKALGRGKHTTRHIELFEVNGGYLADSPGFGSLDFDNEIDILTLSQTFKEFFINSDSCKFSKCTHINEPGCKIKELVNSKDILKSRYDNYLSFVNDIKSRKKKY